MIIPHAWLPFALLATVLWAASNVVDTYLVRDKQVPPLQLVIITGIFLAIPGVVLVLAGLVRPLPWQAFPWALVAAVAGLVTYLPYYMALSKESTEHVVLLWNITPLLTAVFAFVVLGERLDVDGWIGLLLLALGIVYMTLPAHNRPLPLRATVLMSIATAIYAAEGVARRGLFLTVPFLDGFAYVSILVGVTAGGLWCYANRSRTDEWRMNWLSGPLLLSFGLDVAASASAYFAASIGLAAYVSAVGGLQPLVVVLMTACLPVSWLVTTRQSRPAAGRVAIASLLAVCGLWFLG